MTIFAYCNNFSTKIYQVDTDTSLVPLLAYDLGINIKSLAALAGSYVIAGGPSHSSIFSNLGGTNTELHHDPGHISYVRFRDGSRIFFSKFDPAENTHSIFEIKDGKPVLYYTVNMEELTIPNPCIVGDTIKYYSGDFVFAPGDVMYLSSGNIGGLAQAGIYKVTGAGPTGVTGTAQRIYLAEGPIMGLCFIEPDQLYFVRSGKIYALNLNTLTESLVYDLSSFTTMVTDITQDAALKPTFWPIRLWYTFIFWFWQRVNLLLGRLAWGNDWRKPNNTDKGVV